MTANWPYKAALKHCSFLNRQHCLNCQFGALSRMSFKLGYPIKAKKIFFFFAKYHLLNLNENKNDHFQHHRKTKKSRFLPSCFLLQKSSLQNQRSTFTVTFSPFLSLELHVFVLFRFPGRDAAFWSSASWPWFNFQ